LDPLAASDGSERLIPCAYSLPRIPFLRLRCTLVAGEAARLPPYHGSLLRGAFGHALRAAVCSMGPAQECATCRLRAACAYTRVFETLVEGAPPPFLKGLATAPRPYVFEPRSGGEVFSPGDTLSFDLVLFGQAAELAAYAVLAIERMAAAGLGARRHAFALERVEAPEAGSEGREVFSRLRGAAAPGALAGPLPFVPPLSRSGGGALPMGAGRPVTAGTGTGTGVLEGEDGAREPQPEGQMLASGADAPAAGASRALLRFLTPTRLKAGGRLIEGVGVRGLAFAMIRRVLEVAHFHVPGAAVDWTFRPLLECTGAVRIVASDLRWQDWQRYSNRQGRSMELGGFVGTLEIAGEVGPLVPLLRTAEVLHVGKGATFGLGQISAEIGN
jgi:hypothetical protein